MVETSPTQHTLVGTEAKRATRRLEIDTSYAAERWRYVCPHGHIDWRGTPEGFVCLACEEFGEAPGFSSLIDRRSGEPIPREAVRIVRSTEEPGHETG